LTAFLRAVCSKYRFETVRRISELTAEYLRQYDPGDDQVTESKNALALSIVVCTHNRPETLEQLLGILRPQIAGQPIEIIVVDSASRPAAAHRVRQLVEGQDNVRLIRLDTPGLSVARNAGVQAVKTEWIGFIDDDELPAPDWIELAKALINRLPADCAVCGGNVLPVPAEGDMPAIGPKWMAYLSTIDHQGEFDQTDNLACGLGHSLVRLSALQSVGSFDPSLGRSGTSLLSGEDVLMLNRLVEAGWRIWHSDTLKVGHVIEPERLTRAWVRKRAYWEGVSVARMLHLHDPKALWAATTKIFFVTPALAVLNLLTPGYKEFDLRYAYATGFLTTALKHGKSASS
jgi:glycosyltransferase involved in cell wall biosynthesis